MSTPTPTVINVTKLGPGTLTVGEETDDVTPMDCHISAGEFATDKSQDDPIPVLCGSKVASAAEYTATIGGTVLLDLADPNSIFYYSHAHKGEQVPVHYVPNTEVGLDIAGTITMDPLGIAGDIGQNATADFEWDFVEFPEIAPPTTETSASVGAGDVAPLVEEPAA
jgi:hypothetical protein